MALTSISTTAIQQILTSQLQQQQANLAQLDEQLASGAKYSDLTDYSPSDALNLMNLQNSATQSQAYIGVISTVQARLSGYDTTMTDMESIASQAQTLADGNATYDASTAGGIAATASNFLVSVGVDLNQQIGGRYIYGGANYTTAPVTSPLSGLDTSTLSNAIYTDGATLPAYDANYAAGTDTLTTSGQTVTVAGTVTAGQSSSVTVNGKTYSYTAQTGDTPTAVAAALASEVVVDIPGTTAAAGVLTVGGSGTISAASSATTSTASYTSDSATIGSGYTVPYGVSSNNPAFQQLVAGLRYMQAAGNTTDPDTYAADMKQAASLLTAGLSALQSVHAGVANNINSLTAETTAQKNAINSLTTQVDNIQQVDITQVSTELTQLQVQLQASYSATGIIEKLSIVSYL